MLEGENATRLRGITAAFTKLLHDIGGTAQGGERFGDRHLALANTHFEDAVMRVERALSSRATET